MEESVITCCSQYIKGTKKTNHNRNTINNFFSAVVFASLLSQCLHGIRSLFLWQQCMKVVNYSTSFVVFYIMIFFTISFYYIRKNI